MSAARIVRRRGGHGAWSPIQEGLRLLDREGSPFLGAAFRSAWTSAYPEWTDVRYAAAAPDGTTAAVAAMAANNEAVSMPFNPGGIVATKSLDRWWVSAFLDSLRSHNPTRLTCSARNPATTSQ